MQKLPGETVLTELEDADYVLSIFKTGTRRLRLTTHRVRYQRSETGGGGLRSIMLEEVAACFMTRSSRPVFLVYALLSLIAGAVLTGYFSERNSNELFLAAGALAGVAFVTAYFLSQQRVLRVVSAGGAITFALHGLDADDIRGFIDELERAKDARYHGRHSTPPPLPRSAGKGL